MSYPPCRVLSRSAGRSAGISDSTGVSLRNSPILAIASSCVMSSTPNGRGSSPSTKWPPVLRRPTVASSSGTRSAVKGPSSMACMLGGASGSGAYPATCASIAMSISAVISPESYWSPRDSRSWRKNSAATSSGSDLRNLKLRSLRLPYENDVRNSAKDSDRASSIAASYLLSSEG